MRLRAVLKRLGKALPWRGIAIGWALWTVEGVMRSAILAWYNAARDNDPTPPALIMMWALLNNYASGALSLPFWFLTKRIMARRASVQALVQTVCALAYPLADFELNIAISLALQGFVHPEVLRNAGYTIFYRVSHYLVMIGVWYLLAYRSQLAEQRERERELRLLATQMELASLKSQLNPHFLFNALNAVSALVGANPDKARAVITKLADVLRYALESDRRAYAPLSEELRFTKTYLDIERERFGERLQSRFVVEPGAEAFYAPPMIVQPLAENAVKHGIAPKEEGGCVSVFARLAGEELLIAVEDNGVGMKSPPALDTKRGGRGLAYADARLRKLFGERSALRIQTSDAGTRVEFFLPLLQADDDDKSPYRARGARYSR